MMKQKLSSTHLDPTNCSEVLTRVTEGLHHEGVVIIDTRTVNQYLPEKESYLSVTELEELEKITSHRRKDQFVSSRWLLKTVLSHLLSIPSHQIKFIRGIHGKPTLSKDQNTLELDFNLSHKEDISLLGITTRGQIGVDVEEILTNERILRIAQRYFHPEELIWIQKADSELKVAQRFYQMWSLKESLIKTIGGGIFQNLQSFRVECLESGVKLHSSQWPWSDQNQWSLFEVQELAPFIGTASILKRV